MLTKEYKKIIIERLNSFLAPLGFKRKGNIYQKISGDLTYYIGLQSSMSSNADLLKFSINIEIASLELARHDDDRTPIHLHRHYFRRIGNFLKPSQDKWFLISSMDMAKNESDEIINLIKDNVIPEIEKLKSANDLMINSFGLTDKRKEYYIKVLSQQQA